MKKLSKIFVLVMVFVGVVGCASTELAQVSSLAPEHQINTPDQAKRLVDENSR